MSRILAAILDDESDRGLGRVKKYPREEGDELVTFLVGEEAGGGFSLSFLVLSLCRPHAPTSLCFQNGGLLLET